MAPTLEQPITEKPGTQIGPNRLSMLVRGELDWIVMQALEKDRGRRYETAASLRTTSETTCTTNR